MTSHPLTIQAVAGARSPGVRTPLVVRSPNWLGDAVMALPAVRNLRHVLGPNPITVATPSKIADLWRACPWVNHVLELDKPRQLWATAATLRAGRFACAVLLPNSLRTAAEAKLAGIPQVVGYNRSMRGWLLNRAVPVPEYSPARSHQQYYYIDLVRAVGGWDKDDFPPLVPEGETATPADAAAEPVLALCPGAEYGPAKRWPVEYYAEVARALHEQRGARVEIFGAARDAEVAAELTRRIPFAHNRTGQTTLRELIVALYRARLVLCNDSGAMHLASALGTPTAAVFGSTEPARTGPLGPRTRIFRRHVPCSPCFLRECPLDFACMHGSPPAVVLPVCLDLWDRARGPAAG
ncbi:lipopolysaccharide heptosyltransferase II [Verrucomicrobia bacterium LW23]|nr:lipopolysaccharide heptosyltransferase II [Verrucomicrobia bacterium LW23]